MSSPALFAARETDQFRAMLEHPGAAQAGRLLEHVIAPNLSCEFGRRHGFASIRTISDYQHAVPVHRYDDFRADIGRMLHGESGVLVSEPVRHFFITSGSTAAPKYIPVTGSFIRDKSRAFGVYWNLVHERHPEVVGGKIITNFADSGEFSTTPSGIPSSSESVFWSKMTAATRQRGHFAVPKEISTLRNFDDRYYVLARVLVEEDFSVMMSLNPSTILLFFQKVNQFRDRLINDLEAGTLSAEVDVPAETRAHLEQQVRANPKRAGTLRDALEREGLLKAAHLWPGLRLIVSWRSRMLQPYLGLLKPYVGDLPHDEFLSMASEGTLAIPVETGVSGGALAVGSHFYEFIPEEEASNPNPRTLLADQIEAGRNYVVLLTTSAGLYRYNVGDVVHVRGLARQTPIIEFLYRTGSTCSLTGEKLTEDQVSASVAAAARQLSLNVHGFTAFPGLDGIPHYIFLTEFSALSPREVCGSFLQILERTLREQNLEYRSKRESQRLGAPELWVVRSGEFERLRQSRVQGGANDGQVKPAFLSRDAKFHEPFQVTERIRTGDLPAPPVSNGPGNP